MAIDNWSLRKQKKETSFPAQNKCDNGNNRSQGKCKYKGCAKETTHFCSMSTAVVVLALQPHNKRWEAVALESIFARYYMGAGITYIPIVYISLFSNNIIHFTHAKYPCSNTWIYPEKKYWFTQSSIVSPLWRRQKHPLSTLSLALAYLHAKLQEDMSSS